MRSALSLLRFSAVGVLGAVTSLSCGRSEKVSVSKFDFQPSSELPAAPTTPLGDGQNADALIEKVIAATTSTLSSELSSSSASIFHVPKTPTPVPQSFLSQQEVNSINSSENFGLSLVTPQAMLLTATNLEQILRPVFGVSGQITTTDTRYFTPLEKRNLGEYMMLEVPNLETIRMGLPIKLSQDYIFTLRTFAGRACNNLVNSENSNPSGTANKLIKKADVDSRSVSLETVNSFMSLVFGYVPVSAAGHAGAQDFVGLFAESVKYAVDVEKRSVQSALLDNYKLLCVYLVTDPRTFSR